MKLNSLKDLYTDVLKDTYSAETQITKALPRMAKAATSPELRAAFEEHLDETKNQITRLEQIAESAGITLKGKRCKGMEGLLEEGKEVLEQDGEPAVIDAALIASAQRVEHYEMAAYGCLRTYAQLLGMDEAAQLLQQTLEEEEATDEKLTQLGESGINEAAVAAGAEMEEEE